MNIYAVIALYDEGVWIDENGSEDLLFISLKAAEAKKEEIDTLELEAHNKREAIRFERWQRVNAARAILEANNFEGINEAISYGAYHPFTPYKFESRTHIIVLKVQE